MRLFVLIFVVAGLIPWLLFFSYVEVSAWWGGWLLKNSFTKLNDFTNPPRDEHENICRQAALATESEVKDEKGGDKLPESYVAGYQLRFLNEKDYVIELVCESYVKKNLVLDQKTLFGGLRKIEGSGAFIPLKKSQGGIESRENNGVVVRQYYRKLFVGLKDGVVSLAYIRPEEVYGARAPETTCSGWSGVCCINNTAIGAGKQMLSSDCDACFQACLEQPIVTQFYVLSDDYEDNEGMVQADKPVTFEYDTVDTDGTIQYLSIDFGDGSIFVKPIDPDSTRETERPQSLVKGSIEHTYQCEAPLCFFEATINVRDNDGLENTNLPQMTLPIEVINLIYLTQER